MRSSSSSTALRCASSAVAAIFWRIRSQLESSAFIQPSLNFRSPPRRSTASAISTSLQISTNSDRIPASARTAAFCASSVVAISSGLTRLQLVSSAFIQLSFISRSPPSRPTASAISLSRADVDEEGPPRIRAQRHPLWLGRARDERLHARPVGALGLHPGELELEVAAEQRDGVGHLVVAAGRDEELLHLVALADGELLRLGGGRGDLLADVRPVGVLGLHPGELLEQRALEQVDGLGHLAVVAELDEPLHPVRARPDDRLLAVRGELELTRDERPVGVLRAHPAEPPLEVARRGRRRPWPSPRRCTPR